MTAKEYLPSLARLDSYQVRRLFSAESSSVRNSCLPSQTLYPTTTLLGKKGSGTLPVPVLRWKKYLGITFVDVFGLKQKTFVLQFDLYLPESSQLC